MQAKSLKRIDWIFWRWFRNQKRDLFLLFIFCWRRVWLAGWLIREQNQHSTDTRHWLNSCMCVCVCVWALACMHCSCGSNHMYVCMCPKFMTFTKSVEFRIAAALFSLYQSHFSIAAVLPSLLSPSPPLPPPLLPISLLLPRLYHHLVAAAIYSWRILFHFDSLLFDFYRPRSLATIRIWWSTIWFMPTTFYRNICSFFFLSFSLPRSFSASSFHSVFHFEPSKIIIHTQFTTGLRKYTTTLLLLLTIYSVYCSVRFSRNFFLILLVLLLLRRRRFAYNILLVFGAALMVIVPFTLGWWFDMYAYIYYFKNRKNYMFVYGCTNVCFVCILTKSNPHTEPNHYIHIYKCMGEET